MKAKGLRVCMVYQGFPPLLGGAEIYCHGLAKRLVDKGMKVTFLTAEVPGEPGRENIEGIDVRRIRTTGIPGIRFILYSLGVLWHVLRNRREIDIMHANQIFTAGFIGALAGRLFRRPVITREGTESIGFMKNIRNPLKLPFVRFAIRNTDEIYPNNRKVLEMLLRLGADPERLQALWTPVDTNSFKPSESRNALRKRMGLEGRFVILFAGRLVPFKNPGLLLDSVPALAEKIPSLMVLVAGYGSEEDKLKDKAKSLGIGRHARFLGMVQPDKIHEYYQASDVFVYPAISDPLYPRIPFPSTTIYQAMSSGVPVVSAPDLQFSEGRVPAVKTLKQTDAGFAVSLEPECITKAVTMLYKSAGLRKRLGMRGRSIAEERLSWKRHTGLILKKYASIIRR